MDEDKITYRTNKEVKNWQGALIVQILNQDFIATLPPIHLN